jgi:hypothetical protein
LLKIVIYYLSPKQLSHIQSRLGHWIYREAQLSCHRGFSNVAEGDPIAFERTGIIGEMARKSLEYSAMRRKRKSSIENHAGAEKAENDYNRVV